jgi:hypothetical protein
MGITVLSDFQFDVLEKHLQAEGFRQGGLFQDVLDHMYCLTTRYMENGLSFEQAMKMASSDLHPDGLGGIDEEVTQYLHFSFHCRMNKLLYGAAFVAAFGQTLYILFKTLHWPAANLSLIVACTALLLVVIPILTWQYLRTRSTKSGLVRWRIVSGILALIFFGMGSVFKVMHLPSANIQMLLGTFLLAFVFFPIFFWQQYQKAVESDLPAGFVS